MCLTVAYKKFLIKNQGTDFSFFYKPNVLFLFFFFVLEASSEAGRSSN